MSPSTRPPPQTRACVVGVRRGPSDQPPRTGPAQLPSRAGPSGPGRCWSWPPQPRPRCGPAGSASRGRPVSGSFPRCRASGPSLHLNTAITLPVGVEAYAAYALRGWLARDQAVSARTRRFAKWSAIFSFALGMAGQVACHLMAQAGMTRAPWAITTIVSCLPVLVLGMGTALAHMLRADAEAMAAPNNGTGPSASLRSLSRFSEDQAGPGRRLLEDHRDRSAMQDQDVPASGGEYGRGIKGPEYPRAQLQLDQAHAVARRLAAAGKPVSRRALRTGGVRGSNQALSALARMIGAELAGIGGG